MQHPASHPVINPATIDNNLLEEYIAPRFLRKMKSKVTKTSSGGKLISLGQILSI
jgi:hypothetical protein